jgi:predicted O-linked N-acetylglucosamine transferase (SPINDLY family)
MSALLNNKLRAAREHLHGGDPAAAIAACDAVLAKAPRNPEALGLRGIARLIAGAPADGARDLRQAAAAAPGDGMILEYLGQALLQLGESAEAERVLRQAAALPGAPPSVAMRLGLALLQQGRPADARAPLQAAVAAAPAEPAFRLALAQALAASGDRAGAAQGYEALLREQPGHADALFNLGVLALEANDAATAEDRFAAVLARHPAHADAMVNLAILRQRAERFAEAGQLLERALALAPQHPHAHANLGSLRLRAGDIAAARRHFEAALARLPALPAALEGLGAAARAENRHGEAVRWLRALLAADPATAAGWAALGDSLLQLGELDQAAVAAETAVERDPRLPWGWSLRAQLKLLRGELDCAVALLEKGERITGDSLLLGMLSQHSRHLCDWPRWRRAWTALKPRVLAGEDCGTPFALLCEDLDAREIGDYTRRWAARRFPQARIAAPPPLDWDGRRRLRIGYLSSDFQEHPAAYLIAELLELHDRQAFEILAYSLGPRDEGAMRRRIVAAVDRFVDIAWDPDDVAAEKIRGDGIDILVDLKGYTVGDRLGILARRPSPVQMTWLGYPGTTGTVFIDYLIADPVIIPEGDDPGCSERVLRLPHCYQPIDRKRSIAQTRARGDYGLPQDAPVICCFNQTFKITPAIFAVWMRVLHAVPDSVLWLVDDNRWATANLRTAARDAGIGEDRLVFAPRLPLAEHLARYRVADLAVDTFPYTSHTTASDALWCGCPLVALRGDTFAARVSASILAAARLPALIADNLRQYEDRIVQLATHAELRRDLRRRIEAARATAPLFDTPGFTRALEALYRDALRQSAEP